MATAKRTVDIYSAGCSICKETIELVRRIAGPSADIRIHDMHQTDNATRARALGIRSLPAVVVDGKLAGCCEGRGPNEHVIREDLR